MLELSSVSVKTVLFVAVLLATGRVVAVVHFNSDLNHKLLLSLTIYFDVVVAQSTKLIRDPQSVKLNKHSLPNHYLHLMFRQRPISKICAP